MLFNQITTAVADSTAHHTSEITEQIKQLSLMDTSAIITFLVEKLLKFGFDIAIAIGVFLAGKWLINKIIGLLNKILEKRDVEVSLRTFIESLAKISLMLILISIVLSIIDVDTTSFLALFASAGVAIGMALSGTLQNFAGGVMILLFKPYRVGDFIEAQGQIGTVKQIQIFNTIIHTPDNKVIIVPNGGLSTGIINNFSKETSRRVDWQFGIAYGDDYDTAKQVISNLLDNDNRILKDPTKFIALHSLGDSSVNIVVRAWVKQEHYWDVYFDMNEKVYKEFGNYNLNIPFPQMDVHIKQS